jgi:Sucrase/ferredoxin-like
MARRRELCAALSLANAEPLTATASRIDNWILVEYRGLWDRDLLRGSVLSDGLKSHLRAQLAELPRSRLLFIRRPDRRVGPLAVFFGLTPERGGRFFGVEVEQHDELLDIDFAGSIAAEGSAGIPLDHPLLVVCTHGKRDRCCAKFGRPLYDELCEQAEPDRVWQSTHVGGDRFAGNLVSLPTGLYFGRVDRADVWSLLDELYAGRIALERYRGRCCYTFPEQAAEREVREVTGLTGVDDLRLVSSIRSGDSWTVRFVAGGAQHEVEIAAALGEPTYLTCDAARPVRPPRYVVRRRRVQRRSDAGSPP